MIVTKPLDLPLLATELAAVGIVVPGLGTYIDQDGVPQLITYDVDGAIIELPPEAEPVVDAHVAPPLVVDYVETIAVDARVTTTDDQFLPLWRMPTAEQTVYRATVQVTGIDRAGGATKDAQARLVFKRLTSALVQVGTTVVLSQCQDAAATGWAIQAQAQGTDLVIGVKGAAGRTIDWVCFGDVQSFAPGGR